VGILSVSFYAAAVNLRPVVARMGYGALPDDGEARLEEAQATGATDTAGLSNKELQLFHKVQQWFAGEAAQATVESRASHPLPPQAARAISHSGDAPSPDESRGLK